MNSRALSPLCALLALGLLTACQSNRPGSTATPANNSAGTQNQNANAPVPENISKWVGVWLAPEQVTLTDPQGKVIPLSGSAVDLLGRPTLTLSGDQSFIFDKFGAQSLGNWRPAGSGVELQPKDGKPILLPLQPGGNALLFSPEPLSGTTKKPDPIPLSRKDATKPSSNPSR